MEIIERTAKRLVLSRPFSWDEGDLVALWDALVVPARDVIGDDPRIVYIVDIPSMHLFWGYVGDTIFKREPDPWAERMILLKLVFLEEKVAVI